MKKTKFKIFFFSILILLTFQTFFIAPTKADIPNYTPTIRADWLSVQLGPFSDKDSHSWENKIHFESGGEDLIHFENLGIYKINDSTIIYKSRATFGFEVTAHTYVGFRDVYPDINLDAKKRDYYYIVGYIPWYALYPIPTSYYVEFNYANLESTEREHVYDGILPITLQIKDTQAIKGQIKLGNNTFSVPGYSADILQAKITDKRTGDVGLYKDEFTNVLGIEEGNVKFNLIDSFNSKTQKIVDFLNNYKLGFHNGSRKQITVFQKSVDGSQVGTTFHNANPIKDKEFTFNLWALISPEVTKTVQYDIIKYAGITYSELFGTITCLVGPATRSAKRVIGVHVNNYFMHWEFIVDVEFYATIPSTPELSNAILKDPFLERGDWVWDSSFTGTYEVEQLLADYSLEFYSALVCTYF